MPEVSSNGASLAAIHAATLTVREDVTMLRTDIAALSGDVRKTAECGARMDETLSTMLVIEQEKAAHKKRMREEQWAFARDNWKVIAFLLAVLWMPEAVPSIVAALVPGIGGAQHQVVIVPTSAAAGLTEAPEPVPE
jgi:hypothetical protein